MDKLTDFQGFMLLAATLLALWMLLFLGLEVVMKPPLTPYQECVLVAGERFCDE